MSMMRRATALPSPRSSPWCRKNNKKMAMISESKEGWVKMEHHHGVTTIEFFHPQSNSLPARLLEELTHAVHGAGNDKETRVIILRSAGEKTFCAGASFDELLAI